MGALMIKQIEQENPRELLVEIVEKNRDKDKSVIFEAFRREVIKSQALTRAVQWYFFINMYEYLETSRNQSPGGRLHRSIVTPSERLERRILQARIAENIKQQMVMLDLLMPNEKLMRDCTGSEMAKFGDRYQKIAERVGKNQTVGDALSEEEVRVIMQ